MRNKALIAISIQDPEYYYLHWYVCNNSKVSDWRCGSFLILEHVGQTFCLQSFQIFNEIWSPNSLHNLKFSSDRGGQPLSIYRVRLETTFCLSELQYSWPYSSSHSGEDLPIHQYPEWGVSGCRRGMERIYYHPLQVAWRGFTTILLPCHGKGLLPFSQVHCQGWRAFCVTKTEVS